MKKILITIIVLFAIQLSYAGTVDTILIKSTVMNKEIKCVVIRPDSYKKQKNRRFPVVYLLHGHSGNYNNWIKQVPGIRYQADLLQVIIVCPDGDYNSWYMDSPVDTTKKYETYISKEVPDAIDRQYRAIANKKGRAITGLSMGGHGGLFLGFRHPEIFGAFGSMSGGVDLRPFPKNWQLAQKLGDTILNADNWKNYSVITIIEKFHNDSAKIIIDCGTEDFFYDVNKALHEKMLKLKIQHDYIERPGKHDWNYWTNAVVYQLLFFKKYFDSNL
jgi:S-formylglutathione hydrolase FrmB